VRDWGREEVYLSLECAKGRLERGFMGSKTICLKDWDLRD
jgi:hypothetical protein